MIYKTSERVNGTDNLINGYAYIGGMLVRKVRRMSPNTTLQVGQRFVVEWKGEKYVAVIRQILMVERRKQRCEAYVVYEIPDEEIEKVMK